MQENAQNDPLLSTRMWNLHSLIQKLFPSMLETVGCMTGRKSICRVK